MVSLSVYQQMKQKLSIYIMEYYSVIKRKFWHVLQHGSTLETLHSVKQDRYQTEVLCDFC